MGQIASTILVVLLSLAALPLAAALPHGGTGTMAVLFPPSWEQERAFAIALEANAQPVRFAALGNLLILDGNEPGLAGQLYDRGAWWIGSVPGLSGCGAGR